MDCFRIGRAALFAAACIGAHVGFAGSPASAAECVKIATMEWKAEEVLPDPQRAITPPEFMLVSAMYQPLVWLDDGFQPTPMLAESWESNKDGTEWTFHLRKGVKFHDGSEFDAGDVVYTFRRVLDPNTGSAAKELVFLKPEGVTKVDDHTVLFKPETPVIEFPILIANKFAYIGAEGKSTDEYNSRSYGTGPFMIESFAKGRPTQTLTRFADYWEKGLPKAECITLSGISDPLARTAAVLADNVDVIVQADPRTYAQLEQSSDVKLARSRGGTMMTLSMRVDTPPFDDVRVRKALKLVVDRQRILDNVLFGNGILGNDNPIFPTSADAFSKEVRKRDVEEAKRLLAVAGHADGISVELISHGEYPGLPEMAQLYRQMAAEAGIKVEIKPVATSEWAVCCFNKSPFTVSYWGARPTLSALSIAYLSGAKYNETKFNNPTYDEFINKANATLDDAERRKYFQQAQQLLADEGGLVAPVFASMVAATRADCEGYAPHPDINRLEFRYVSCK